MNNRRKNALLFTSAAIFVLIPVLVMAGQGVSRAVAEAKAAAAAHRLDLSQILSYYGETDPREPLENPR